MKVFGPIARNIAGVILVVILTVSLWLAFRSLQQANPAEGYPAPLDTMDVVAYEQATSDSVIFMSTSDVAMNLTLTPFPFLTQITRTPRPGPTSTPLPLATPAKSNEGTISYLSANADGENLQVIPLSINDAETIFESSTVKLDSLSAPDLVLPSPNGVLLAFIYGTEGGHGIEIYDASTGKSHSVFSEQYGGGSGVFIGWHPDNAHVLFRANETYSKALPGLWLVDIYTGEIEVLLGRYPYDQAGVFGDIQGAAVSPDGTTLAYSLKKDIFSPSELWAVDDVLDNYFASKLRFVRKMMIMRQNDLAASKKSAERSR